MSIEELFLRQIDSVDGNIELIVHPGQPMTCVSVGPFVWNIEHADRDAVIGAIASAMANPDGAYVAGLASGEEVNAGALNGVLYIGSGSLFWKIHFGTASLLVAALSEARQWHRNQLIAAGEQVASC